MGELVVSEMVHQMGLYGDYFTPIREGKKIVEVRLNDKKRREIKIGDTIEFIRLPEQSEVLKVRVTNLRIFDTFEEMYRNISFEDFDCEGWSMKEMLEGTYDIYTPEQEEEWGTLAITIKY
ncbi:ASC-1 homology (ASCH) domain-containing protein [Psychrobacillus psychrodurans]|nr:ASC-1 homology (ASCH) domain-containing protein [Psychrobacillus psychrodurans]